MSATAGDLAVFLVRLKVWSNTIDAHLHMATKARTDDARLASVRRARGVVKVMQKERDIFEREHS